HFLRSIPTAPAPAASFASITFASAFALASRSRATLAASSCACRLVDRISASAARHCSLRVKNLSAINPDLNAYDAEGRVRFSKAVINVRAKSVQMQLPLKMPLASRNLGPVQTARDFDLDALRAEAQRLFNRFAHRAAKGYALL